MSLSITKASKSSNNPISTSSTSTEKPKLASIDSEIEPISVVSPSSAGNSKPPNDKKELKETELSRMEVEEIDEPTPEGSVIRIAKCRIRTSKGTSSLAAAMYTTESV